MSIKIDLALIQTFIDGAYGLDVSHENLSYTPTAGSPYAELTVIPNDITPLTLADSNETDGIFRIILHHPLDKGAITSKTMADTILGDYAIGTTLTYDTQDVLITGNGRETGIAEDGWYRIILTVRYYATLNR